MSQTLRRELRIKFLSILEEYISRSPDLSIMADRLADAALEVAGITSKENPLQNASLDWSIAANMTSEVVAGFAAREQAEKDRAILYEKLMGYGSLPWWNDKGLRRLLKFLLTKTPEEIKSFAEWSKRPYAGLNPVKARQYPNLVMECWNQAFDIEKRGSEPKEHAL
jgi:hypothetical protein